MLSRFPGSRLARACAALLVASIMLVQASPNAFAQATTGVLSGTVTDAVTHAPLANVQVSANAPTGHYTATTNPAGFYAITGMYSDTYTVTFMLSGYNSFTSPGATIAAGQTLTLNESLTKALGTIAHVTARSASSAYQPKQPIDTYTITQKGVQSILGSAPNLSESSLIASLPGGSFDSGGYPVIRGGRENEEEFEFEGIPYVDPFTNQFNNSLAAPGLGLQAAQLTPGLGNAASDNYGTGVFNLVSKRGTYPSYATFQGSIGGPAFRHGLNVEFGWATPNGRLSNYMTLASDQIGRAYGGLGVNCVTIGTCFSRYYQPDREFVDNLIYKFGNNNNQQVQFFIDSAQHNFYYGWGGFNNFNNLCFHSCDPLYLQEAAGLEFGVCGASTPSATCGGAASLFLSNGQPRYSNINTLTDCGFGATFGQCQLSPAEIVMAGLTQNNHLQQYTFQSLGAAHTNPYSYYQPNQAMKLGYLWNINPATNLQAMAYQTNDVVTFDFRMTGYTAFPFTYNPLLQGGFVRGAKLDFTRQMSDKHLLRIGGKYQWLLPVYDQPVYGDSLIFNQIFSTPGGAFEYFTPSQCAQFGLPTDTSTNCSYVYNTAIQAAYCQTASCTTHALPLGTQVPQSYENFTVTRNDWSGYIDDTWSPSDKLTVDAGFKVDLADYHYPTPGMDLNTCTSLYVPYYVFNAAGVQQFQPSTNPNTQTILANGTLSPLGVCPQATFNLTNTMKKPVIPEPIISASYQITPNDTVRAAWGRSVEFPTLGLVDSYTNPAYYNSVPGDVGGLAAIPGNTILTGPAAGTGACGFYSDQYCVNYGEENLWNNYHNLTDNVVPIAPVRTPVFINGDFSYEHQFTHGFLNGVAFKLTPYWRKAYDETALVANPQIKNGQIVTNPATGAIQYAPPIPNNAGKSQDTGVEFQMTRDVPYGLSGQVTVTYQNEQTSVIPVSGSEDFYPSIPAASLALGNVYRVGFLSPLQASWDLSYQTRSGWRINPQITWNEGYPISPATTYPTFLHGIPINLINTNATAAFAGAPAGGVGQYVDPMNPGSFFVPNIAATRGTPMTAAPGGKLGHPSSNTNITIEYNGQRYWNAGITVFNVFDELYGGPVLNGRYQPLATGYSGAVTGQNATSWGYQTIWGQSANVGSNRFGQNAYQDTPNGIRSYYFYLTLKM